MNIDNKKTYFKQIDTLKGIAIFLVVLGHSIIKYPVDLHDNVACDFLYRWLSSVHMPLFFVVSGFCYSYRSTYQEFIKKKIKRLLIPYIVFSFIDILPRYLLSQFVNRPRGVGESLLKMALHGGEYWFLYVLFIIFLIYPFIDKLIGKNLYIDSFLAVILLVYSAFAPEIDLFLFSKVVYYIAFFMMGVVVKRLYGNKVFDIFTDKSRIFVYWVLMSVIWICFIYLDLPYTSAVLGVLSVLTMYFLVHFEWTNNLFNRFGKYSLQLYLLNGYLLVISRTIIVSFLGITNPLLIIAFNVFVDFICSYIFIKYVCEKIGFVRTLMGMN